MNTLNQNELFDIVGGSGDPYSDPALAALWQQILALHNNQVEQAEAAFLAWLDWGSAN